MNMIIYCMEYDSKLSTNFHPYLDMFLRQKSHTELLWLQIVVVLTIIGSTGRQ